MQSSQHSKTPVGFRGLGLGFRDWVQASGFRGISVNRNDATHLSIVTILYDCSFIYLVWARMTQRLLHKALGCSPFLSPKKRCLCLSREVDKILGLESSAVVGEAAAGMWLKKQQDSWMPYRRPIGTSCSGLYLLAC